MSCHCSKDAHDEAAVIKIFYWQQIWSVELDIFASSLKGIYNGVVAG